MLRPTNLSGMVMKHRDDPNVRIGEDLVLPVCDVCGDMTFTAEQAEALDHALERSCRRKRLRSSGC